MNAIVTGGGGDMGRRDGVRPQQDPFLSGVPLARYGTPAEVAQTIAFLHSPAASFICGATIAIDGGLTVSPT
jgi:3-oxoacyl-[acyl-carrier protein] reductase